MGRQIKIEFVTYIEHHNYLMIKIKNKNTGGKKQHTNTWVPSWRSALQQQQQAHHRAGKEDVQDYKIIVRQCCYHSQSSESQSVLRIILRLTFHHSESWIALKQLKVQWDCRLIISNYDLAGFTASFIVDEWAGFCLWVIKILSLDHQVETLLNLSK